LAALLGRGRRGRRRVEEANVSAADVLPLLRAYDLRHPGAGQQACLHRRLWGRRFTDIHALDAETIALVFRKGGLRGEAWERVRLKWILAQDPEREAA
jgi:hypothetical protein